MEERKKVICISGVKKQYRLGQIGAGTLQGDLQSLWARMRKKEDPNEKIGSRPKKNGQKFYALDGVDLTIYKGEAVGIIGRNGAGKSTLLKLLSRITAPTEGTIDLYGRITSMLEVGTGFNAQMTGRENIYMNGAILGMSKAEIDSKLEEIIEFSEIREFIDTPVKRYSSGMFVKLAFAVAAHLTSDIMIMDEVLAVGDMAFQKKCISKMQEYAHEEGRTVLYVSHNMNTIRELCDRCIVMDKGKIIFDGPAARAIAIYSAMASDKDDTDFNLESKPHTGRSRALTRIAIKDKTAPRYTNDELLKIDVCTKCDFHLDHVRLRLTFKNEDGNAVGTILSTMMSFDTTGKIPAVFEVPLNQLSPGRYSVTVGIGAMMDDDFVKVDNVPDAFNFEITSGGIKEWSNRGFGNVIFPEITAK